MKRASCRKVAEGEPSLGVGAMLAPQGGKHSSYNGFVEMTTSMEFPSS